MIHYAKKGVGMKKYLVGLLVLSTLLFAKPFSFIALGDTPYSSSEESTLKGEVIGAIKAFNPPFVAFYGDLKSGGESCTNELLRVRRDMVLGILPERVFYTPGDNEWTDCDRASLSIPFSELERLSYLKELFFAKPLALPNSWHYERQPNFVENARWMQEEIMFVTLHMVSTNNGRQDILKDDIQQALAMVNARDEANRVWLQSSFAKALKQNAKALVIITQADVSAADGAGLCTAQNPMACDAFMRFRQELRYEAKHFTRRGQKAKPVLLVHGDTNPYCMDSTFGGKSAPNLWRLNAWGDFKSPADATVISINTANKKRPFKAKTLLGKLAPDASCH